MKAFAADFLKQLIPTRGISTIPKLSTSTATVIGLRGDLGAGKTTFTQIFANLVGISENVTSPTFVILKKYKLDGKVFGDKFVFFIHIDAYRLKGGFELNAIGWQGIISDPKNLVMIEWPELVTDVMPADTIFIDFKHVDENTREIILPTSVA